ncbi:MAG: hypothetical protein D3918_02390 [Candidatus Electrothrix sp. AX2]|nr:hypothetical protein [Candidatus Electrothrix gigas]
MDESYTSYLINKKNIIESVDDGWVSFAEKNHGKELINERVVYRDINAVIACKKCQELYDMLIESVRAKQKTIYFPFRCDSPEARRYMTMEMAPLHQKKILFTSYLEKEDRRTPLALLDIMTARSDEIIMICSWCKRIRAEKDIWLEAEEAVEKMLLFNRSPLPQLSHGICPSCYDLLLQKIV